MNSKTPKTLQDVIDSGNIVEMLRNAQNPAYVVPVVHRNTRTGASSCEPGARPPHCLTSRITWTT